VRSACSGLLAPHRRRSLPCSWSKAALLATVGRWSRVACGLGCCRLLQQFYPEFPFQAPPWAIPAALGVSCSVGLVFGILPARHASRLDPVLALMRRKA